MDHYLDALLALEYILDKVGQYHWKANIRRDIRMWIEKQDSTHQENYGGMGSFNDIAIGSIDDNVTPKTAPWIHRLFLDIQSIAYALAENPPKITPAKVEKMIGNLGFQLEGMQCLDCGYASTSIVDISAFVINNITRQDVLEFLKKGALIDLVKSRFTNEPDEYNNVLEKTIELVEKNGFTVIKKKTWQKQCNWCNSKRMDLTYWILNETKDKFLATSLDASMLPQNIRSAFK